MHSLLLNIAFCLLFFSRIEAVTTEPRRLNSDGTFYKEDRRADKTSFTIANFPTYFLGFDRVDLNYGVNKKVHSDKK